MGLLWFACEMEKKLKENSHKLGWEDCPLSYLKRRLTQERKELDKALKAKDTQRVIGECADVANFAMMIADNVNDDLYDWGFECSNQSIDEDNAHMDDADYQDGMP